MKKLVFVFLCLCVMGCAEKKPPLEQTQIVDGKSIVMPPEFYVLPKTQETAPDSQSK